MHEPAGYTDTQGARTLPPNLNFTEPTEPQRPGLLVDLGDTLLRTGDFAEAVSVYQKALDELGPDWRIYEKLADALLGQGNICEAIEALGSGFIAGVDDYVIATMNITKQRPEVIALKDKFNALVLRAEGAGVSPLKLKHGWYVPRSDINSFPEMPNIPLYKGRPFTDLEHAKVCVTKTHQHRVAVDVGGNIGSWSCWLADHFDHVEAFEPLPILQQCFEQNIRKENVTLHKFALGAVSSRAEMAIFDMMTGGSFISAVLPESEQGGKTNDQKLVVKRLDDLQLQDVDFIKIDTEGFEAFVVQGAMETITRCKPVMYVEQIWGARYRESGQHDAVRMLLGLGAVATALGNGSNFLIEWP